jgi:hypothetical protein
VLSSTDPSVPSQDLTYSYGAMGNRVYTIENGVRTKYTNQYTKVGDTIYVFDADDNLVSESSSNGAAIFSALFRYDQTGLPNVILCLHDRKDGSCLYT